MGQAEQLGVLSEEEGQEARAAGPRLSRSLRQTPGSSFPGGCRVRGTAGSSRTSVAAAIRKNLLWTLQLRPALVLIPGESDCGDRCSQLKGSKGSSSLLGTREPGKVASGFSIT